ncbi:MAG TPA: GntR family transcriptional regulator [Bryobacteraceae bacterium]|jgi:DNA-binding GntR family transcriptional regulator|nr:GntR family transcriptional regulator [Bryobacteraceae bacterium]
MADKLGRLRRPVRLDPLATQTFDIIKDAIFQGRLLPGQALREMQLAKSFSVSQATVREALAQLEQTGLVVRSATRRITVTSFSREEIRDRLAMRLVLEEMAAVKAGEKLNEEELAELWELARSISELVRGKDHFAVTQADVQFHRTVWMASGSAVLEKTLTQLTTPLFAFLSVLHKKGMVDLRNAKPHEPIVEALETRKAANIRREIHKHIEGSYQEFFDTGLPSLNALVNGDAKETVGD